MAESARASDPNFLISRLERAAQRANDHWFPSNPELVAKIQRGFKDGNYDLDIEFFLNELKMDFSLFTFCVKEAISELKGQGISFSEEMNPFEILRALGLEKLSKIFDRSVQRISTHTLEHSSEIQHSRLKEAMISASAAEAMAPFQSIDPEVGFSTAILRQLGLALIAWNYPTVYQRAIEKSDETVSLESAIDEALGFSPTVFGAYILSRWGVAPELRLVVGEEPGAREHGPINELQSFLKKICEVGEALARASSPEQYPTAEADWESARTAIESTLGPDGMRVVQEHVRKNCESYRTSLKLCFADTQQLNPGAKIAACREDNLNERNPFVRGCLPYLKKAFRELYSAMDPNTISQHSVRKLTNTIIPLAGFSGGCVFVLDPNSKNFVPRLTIGSVALRTLGPVALSDYSNKSDPVIVAFDCQTPMIEHSRGGAATDIACITAALGNKQKLGVLYLELPQSTLNDFDKSILTSFKAVRKALEDALHLS